MNLSKLVRCDLQTTAIVMMLFLRLGAAQVVVADSGSTEVSSRAGEPGVVPPFVAGFDRFARHGELSAEASGELLLTELSCTACHHSGLPEMQPKPGPSLKAAGGRLQTAWLKKFLESPSGTKPGTTMPDLLNSLPEAERSSVADALVAFVMSLNEPFPEVKASGLTPVPMEFWNRGDSSAGKVLYHQIGCVACHEPDPDHEAVRVPASPVDQLLDQLNPEEIAELGLASEARQINSVPLPNLWEKYNRQSLTFFLLNPEHVRPAGRMPNFGLAPVDAANIATWLLTSRNSGSEAERPSHDSADPSPSPALLQASLVNRGRQLFSELRCVSCHTLPDMPPAKSAVPLDRLRQTASTGCLAETPAGVPFYGLDELQKSSLRSAIVQIQGPGSDQAAVLENRPAGLETVPDAAESRLLKMNCLACHERNKRGGIARFRKSWFETVGHVDIGDEGRLPPGLTGVGARLTIPWLRDVFRGRGTLRSYMTVRMPQFPENIVKDLPELLRQSDSTSTDPVAESKVFASQSMPSLVAAGRALMDTGCVQCHSFRGETLPGTVGIDLEGVASRIHPQWFHDFLKDPGAVKARTRMPTFFPAGRSQNKEILGGDMELQIAAMWAYLKELKTQPLPEKIVHARSQNYELTPGDRPIILRTFMRQAGTHAVAVGFSQKVHFAFDAEQICVAQAWRGRFLDAEGTWFVRSAPPADPLGEQLIDLPAGVPIADLPNESHVWPQNSREAGYRFQGYRLDKAGVPSFLYRFAEYEVNDRIVPTEDHGLQRTITVTRRISHAPTDQGKRENPKPVEHAIESNRPVWFRAHIAKVLKMVEGTPAEVPAVISGDNLRIAVAFSMADSENPTSASGRHTIKDGRIRKSGDLFEWLILLAMPETADDSVVIEVNYKW